MNQDSNKEPNQQTNAAPKFAFLLDDNLMSAVRVQGQLEAAGFQVRLAKILLTEEIEAPEIVLINLGSRSLKGVAQIESCRARFPAARVLGFCGHTEIEIRQAAKAAGIGRIFTNEEAMIELAKLLKNC